MHAAQLPEMQTVSLQHSLLRVHDIAIGRQQRQFVVSSHTEPVLAWQQSTMLSSRRQLSPSPAQIVQ